MNQEETCAESTEERVCSALMHEASKKTEEDKVQEGNRQGREM